MVVIEMLMMVVIIMNIISIFWGVEEGRATCITYRNYDDGDLAWRKIRRHVSPRAILSLSPLDIARTSSHCKRCFHYSPQQQ